MNGFLTQVDKEQDGRDKQDKSQSRFTYLGDYPVAHIISMQSTWINETVDIPFDGKKFYELLQEKIRNSTQYKYSVFFRVTQN